MDTFDLEFSSCQEVLDHNVLITDYETQAEQRRKKSGKKIIGFAFTSPNLTKADYDPYRDFFNDHEGAFTPFSFTSPFDDISYTCRFVPESFRSTFSGAVFTLTWEFKVIHQQG